jgi:hypothetical protein
MLLVASACNGSPSERPVADAGPDQDVAVGATVQLDASGSSHPDGNALAFTWSLDERPAGSTAELTRSTGPTSSFVADVAGDFEASVEVSDGTRTDRDAVLVTASGLGNQPPTADAGSDVEVVVGGVASLDGSGSSDPDGDTLSFAWAVDARPAGSVAPLQDPDTATPQLVPDVAGRYDLTLTVDDGGAKASDGVVVRATAGANAAPVLGVVSDQVTLLGTPVDVPVIVSDENPETVVIEASSDDEAVLPPEGLEILGAGAERTLRLTPSSDTPGTAAVELIARDAPGATDATGFELRVDRPYGGAPAKLTASDAGQSDNLGRAVAVDDGWALAAAAPFASGEEAGVVYVFELDDDWIQADVLTPDDGEANDQFGRSIAMDGAWAVIGSPLDDDLGTGSGSAYLFERVGDDWLQRDKVTASDGSEDDDFGRDVAISGDRIVVGAPFAGPAGPVSGGGAAYLFERSGDTWTEVAAWTAPDGGTSDGFGRSVAISGSRALVGAPGHEHDGVAPGAAFAFTRTDGAWTSAPQELIPVDGTQGDSFGFGVAMDGDIAVVGAWLADAAGDASGAAYPYAHDGDAWRPEAPLVPSALEAHDYLGRDVAVRAGYALLGAYGDDAEAVNVGAAYVFRRGVDGWAHQHTLRAPDRAQSDHFGRYLALGDELAISGAHFHDAGPSDAGAAYVFERAARP